MKKRRKAWKSGTGDNFYIDPSAGAYASAKAIMNLTNSENTYLRRPWKAIFHETFIWFLRFFPLALMSFYLFIIPLVPAWVMMLYKYFYVFLSKLKKFGISKIKYGIFSAVVIVLEVVASHFIRELLFMAYKLIFN